MDLHTRIISMVEKQCINIILVPMFDEAPKEVDLGGIGILGRDSVEKFYGPEIDVLCMTIRVVIE